ncbi:unnamed protein product [Auanema sp. JU1783]|nr:unnamed protein product [Auanema sp. JU1783]
MTSFGLDFEDDEDCWLTPSVKDVAVQSSKPFDIKEYLGEVKLSESAATLSKKIAKYTKKRAVLERMSSLASVKEESPCSFSTNDEISSSDQSSGLGVSVDTDMSSPEVFPEDASCSKSVSFAPTMSPMSPMVKSAFPISSTPIHPIAHRSQKMLSVISPIRMEEPDSEPQLEKLTLTVDDDEEFYDAADDFSEEAFNAISLTASFSSIESILSDRRDPGQSCIRTGMTQSLIKVDEEDIPSSVTPAKLTLPRQARSSSVSPRSATSSLGSESSRLKPGDDKSLTTPLSSRNGTLRRSLGEQALSRSQFSTLSKQPTNNETRLPRNPRVMKSHSNLSPNSSTLTKTDRTWSKNSLDTTPSRPVSRASPILREEFNRDLQQVTSLAQQQEEALRQAVRNSNERKYSWQGEPNKSNGSPHSSAGSLASSKSVDIAVLNKTTATPNSRIPGPSRLPRRTGIPVPTKIQPNPRQTNASMAKFGGDPYDDCF